MVVEDDAGVQAAVTRLVVAMVWIVAVATLAVALVRPLFADRWMGNVAFALVVAVVSSAPFVAFQPDVLQLFAADRRQYLMGLVALLITLSYLGLLAELGWQPLTERLVLGTVVVLGEEIVFRGFLWSQLERMSPWFGFVVPVNVVLFVVTHVPRVLILEQSVWALIAIAVLGLVLAILRHWSGRLFAPAVAHLVWNML